MDHLNHCKHTIIYQDKFSDIDRYIALAKDYDKVTVNDDYTLTLETPPTIPPSPEQVEKATNPTTVEQ